MTDLSDQVIEAAAKARYEHLAGRYPGWEPWEDQAPETRAAHVWAMEAGIRAADRARAPEIVAAVDALMDAAATLEAAHWGHEAAGQVSDAEQKRGIARRDLLALLGLPGGEPEIFETMVFAGDYPDIDNDTERYATWADAEAGHAAMVDRVRSHLIGPEG